MKKDVFVTDFSIVEIGPKTAAYINDLKPCLAKGKRTHT
jgi:hypothetical protein